MNKIETESLIFTKNEMLLVFLHANTKRILLELNVE